LFLKIFKIKKDTHVIEVALGWGRPEFKSIIEMILLFILEIIYREPLIILFSEIDSEIKKTENTIRILMNVHLETKTID